MPELTPKLGIKKPLGNETVNRTSFNENWDIIDANVVADKGGVPSIQAGLDADKPAAGTAGRLYVATDTQIIYRDTGTTWAKVRHRCRNTIGCAGQSRCGRSKRKKLCGYSNSRFSGCRQNNRNRKRKC